MPIFRNKTIILLGLLVAAAAGLFWVQNSQGICLGEIDGAGNCIPPPLPIYGCTDPVALNYDPNADTDDGSCTYTIPPQPTIYTYPLVVSVGQQFRIEWDAATTTELLWFITPDGYALCPSAIIITATSGFTGSDNCRGNQPGYGWVLVMGRGDGRNGTGLPGPITSIVRSRPITVPGNNARFIEHTAPATMQINQTSAVSVRVRNTGTMPWIYGDPYPVGIGSQAPQDNMIWGLNRVDVPYNVVAGDHNTPGGEVTFNFNITAPSTPGTYNFVWQMLQEGVGSEWFGYNSNFGGNPFRDLGMYTILVSTDSTDPTVNAFGITPATVSSGGTFTATFDVSDTGGSYLNRVELWRANYDVTNCNGTNNLGCDFGVTPIDSANAAPSINSWVVNSGNSPLTDSPATSGQYVYGLHVYDNAGNMGTEGDNGIVTPVGTVDPAPSVTVNQASVQADPTAASPINFTATFSETVTGFAADDVTITGTAGGTKTVAITGAGPVYNVAVSDMTSSGTVIASIVASRVTDAAGNNNTASTSTDNTVSYDATDPAVTAFSISPNLSTVGTQLTATFSATDETGGSGLWKAELWRTPFVTDTCDGDSTVPDTTCNWTLQQTNNGPPTSATSWTNGTLTDTPPAAGQYVYGVHVFDNAGNMGTETDNGIATPVVIVNPLNPPPPPPTLDGSGGSGVVNTTCGQLTVNWLDNSSNETGFRVYRSTTSGSGYVQVGGDRPANATSYTDTPPSTGVVYYYIVRSFINYPPVVLSADSAEASAMNLACTANFANSSYSIISVNGNAYSGSTIINNTDTVTYQITVVNSGPGTATINYICAYESTNLTNLTNLTVSGSGASGSTITQSSPNCSGSQRLNVSGAKDVANNWLVTLDATISSATQNIQDLVTSSAVIHYTDITGSNTHSVTGPSIIVNTSKGKSPDFREVAP